jgi:hypothetical protein
MVLTSVKTDEKSKLQFVMGWPPFALIAAYNAIDIQLNLNHDDHFAHLQNCGMSCLIACNLCELLNWNLCRLESSCLEIGVLEFLKGLRVEGAFKLLQNIREHCAIVCYLELDLFSPFHSQRTVRSVDAARLQGAAETRNGAARATRVIEKCIYELGRLP